MKQITLPAALGSDSFPAATLRGGAPRPWRPGHGGNALYEEVFAPGDEASGAGLALALARDKVRCLPRDEWRQAVLWVQDKAAVRLTGRPCRAGLPEDLRAGLIHVAAARPEDALFALEEGLRCPEFAFVIGEIAGNPRVLDLTASRRLSLAAERNGVPLYLIRVGAERDLGSARMRWAVRSVRSPAPRWNPAAPGTASWRAELFRACGHAPGEWILRDEDHSLFAERPGKAASPEGAADAPPHSGRLAGAPGA